MKITLLDLDSIGQDLDLTPLESLGDFVCYGATAPEEIIPRLQGSDVAIINKIKMTREILEQLPQLKLICVAATGFDNIDTACCREKGIACTNVPGYSTESVAMVTVGMVLSLMMQLPTFADFVKTGTYTASGTPNRLTPAFHDLCGKTWGIVGWGNIGKKVAEIARAFGCRVLYTRSKPESGCCDIDTLCRESDILTLHCPLNDTTRGLIDNRRLGLMKAGVILVNVARGAVWEEPAVAQALVEGKIGALGCDVYSQEPFGPEHPFQQILGRDNVCLTPHIAWASFEARTRVIAEMAENIRAFSQGEKRNRVD